MYISPFFRSFLKNKFNQNHPLLDDSFFMAAPTGTESFLMISEVATVVHQAVKKRQWKTSQELLALLDVLRTKIFVKYSDEASRYIYIHSERTYLPHLPI